MRTLKVIGSSIIVYAVVAACSSVSDSPIVSSSPDASIEDGEAVDVRTSTTEDSSSLVNPVPTADAADPPTYESTNATCIDSGFGYQFAQAVFAGASAAELAHVKVMIPVGANAPAGYTSNVITPTWVKDGAVGFVCPSPAPSSVTFTRRKP